MISLSFVAMTGLENRCITYAYLQWLFHSGERAVAHRPLVKYPIEKMCSLTLHYYRFRSCKLKLNLADYKEKPTSNGLRICGQQGPRSACAPCRQNLQHDLCDQQRLRSACTSIQYDKVLVHPSLDSTETVEGTCCQRRLGSDCKDAQADLSLHWSHRSYCRFFHKLAYITKTRLFKFIENLQPKKREFFR